MITKELLQAMSEAELRQQVLIPLLKAMGFQDVYEYHGGSGEQGKDIVCWKSDELNSRVNYALVAKAVPLSGQARVGKGTASEVAFQIQQCFGKGYLDQVTTVELSVNRCWVVSNQEISKEAEESLKSALSSSGLDRLTSFINGDKLWELIEEFLPVRVVLQKLNDAQKIFDELDTHFRPRVLMTAEGINISIDEKFPGAAQEKPFEINGSFRFPETPEGRNLKEAYERMIDTGAALEIPPAFIEHIEFPEFMKSLMPSDAAKTHTLKFGPVHNNAQLVIRVSIICDDGDRIDLDNVYLKAAQTGIKEATLSNEGQLSPIKVRLVLRPQEQVAVISFGMQSLPLNVYQVLTQLRFMGCLSKANTLIVINLENGMHIMKNANPSGVGNSPPPRLIRDMKALVALQIRTGKQIILPKRELTSDELETVNHLVTLVTKGKVEGTWSELKISLNKRGIESVLKGHGAKGDRLTTESDESEVLFDTEIPLGRVSSNYGQGIINNLEEVKRLYESILNDDSYHEVIFVPKENDRITRKYLDWFPLVDIDNTIAHTASDDSRAARRKSARKRRH